MISGMKTMIVEVTFGMISPTMIRTSPRPCRRAASTNSRSRSGSTCAADRLGDVGDVDEADHRPPARAASFRYGAARCIRRARARRRGRRRGGIDGICPDDVEHPRQQAVEPAAAVAGEDADDDRQDHRDDRRDGAYLQRVAPAVQQAHRHVTAVGVGTEEVLRLPRRSDRQADRVDDVGQLAADPDLLGDVVVVGPGVRDVARVHGREQAQDDDDEEQAPEERARSGCGAASSRRACTDRYPEGGRPSSSSRISSAGIPIEAFLPVPSAVARSSAIGWKA